MVRSRKLTLTDWTSANNALMQYFDGNKSKLAKHVDMSRTTITNFFNQKPIGESSFRKICLTLRLNWKQVVLSDIAPDFLNNQPEDPTQPNEALIEQVRDQCRQKILERHSRIHLLSGEEIEVDQLYVDVWLLEKPEYKHFNTPKSLLSNFDITKDRLALGKRIERNPGFEVANSNSKLVILGKPGSGKTTFLKHLAIDWCKGKFQPDSITIFLELRRIQDSQWNIWNVIGQELHLNDWHQFAAVKEEINVLKKNLSKTKIKLIESQLKEDKKKTEHSEDLYTQISLTQRHPLTKEEKQIKQLEERITQLEEQLDSFPLHHLLKQGRLLILMDGLDESATSRLRYTVVSQLREVSQTYSKNRFIMTSRTQTKGIPNCFSLVEIADFSLEQTRQFVRNWFVGNGQNKTEANEIWETVRITINTQPDFRELTVTPVLLSLLCLVLQDEGKMPTERGWLYKKGINLLLRRWNNEKAIENWEIGTKTYRQLSVEKKEALLIKIAAQKFENPDNFVLFEQDELVKQIAQNLQLSNMREGVDVLRAIEAQHGLLIERADELWSFSHLTFQEYFAVQWLTQLSSQQLTERITNQRWQKIIEQLVKSQQPADRLLRLLKQAIDQFIAHELIIQTFLGELLQKSNSLQTKYKPGAIRAFYYSLTRVRRLDLSLAVALDKKIDRSLDHDLDLDLSLSLALNLDQNFDRFLKIASALDRNLDQDFDLTVALDLDRVFNIARFLNLSSDLISDLQKIKNKVPTSNRSEEIQCWWSLHGAQWTKQLQQVMIKYRNIGHDWQFTLKQQKQLQRYYKANKFMVHLMKIEGAVSEECRAEIEDGLLLPWVELQCRQPHLYGDLER